MWLEGRLVIVDNSDEMISKIYEIIEKAIDNIDFMPAAAIRKLNSLLRDLSNLLTNVYILMNVIY